MGIGARCPGFIFDQRNAIDLYGKTRPMLLSIVSPCRVMEAHWDLVDVAHTLRQIICAKE